MPIPLLIALIASIALGASGVGYEFYNYYNKDNETGAIDELAANDKNKGNGSGGGGGVNSSYAYQQSQAEEKKKEEDVRYASVLNQEYKTKADEALKTAIAQQENLNRNKENLDTEYQNQFHLAQENKDQSDVNTRTASANDFFTNLANAQASARQLRNVQGQTYGSANATLNNLVEQQNATNNRLLADSLQKSLQENSDTYTGNINNLANKYNENMRSLANEQSEINSTYQREIGDLTSGLYSSLAGISDDVLQQYFNDDGTRKDQPEWSKNGATRPDDLYDASKWTEFNKSYEDPTRIGNVMNIAEVQKKLQNRSDDAFKSAATNKWTQL